MGSYHEILPGKMNLREQRNRFNISQSVDSKGGYHLPLSLYITSSCSEDIEFNSKLVYVWSSPQRENTDSERVRVEGKQ